MFLFLIILIYFKNSHEHEHEFDKFYFILIYPISNFPKFLIGNNMGETYMSFKFPGDFGLARKMIFFNKNFFFGGIFFSSWGRRTLGSNFRETSGWGVSYVHNRQTYTGILGILRNIDEEGGLSSKQAKRALSCPRKLRFGRSTSSLFYNLNK